jgi:hypothetical protein
MTNRSRQRADDRAEARRRARLAAQGRLEEVDETDGEEADSPGARPGGSFLTRLFPPAPPLPGVPDPLAGFDYDGPLRGLMGSLYVLARNPVPWIGLGTVWAVGRLMLAFATVFGSMGAILGIIASLVSFGALIAAGWIGWPRPWLFGLMASIVGILLYAAVFGALIAGSPATFTGGEAFLGSIYQEVAGFQPLFGALAGWYGGYLRRRMAQNAEARAGGSRRRS